MTIPYIATAAIDASNTTVGFADPNLWFMSPAEVDASLDAMQAMGVNNIRISVFWAGVEPFPGYYNWGPADYIVNAANERGMGVLAVINSTPGWASPTGAPGYSEPTDPSLYGAFAGQVAERYAGQISAYEIWNEPNAAFFYGPEVDPAGYTELLQAAYPAIKAADPDATVIGGVVGAGQTIDGYTLNPVDFVDQMYDAGAQGYFDALSFHPYQYTTKFTEGGYHPDSPINQLGDIHDLMVANGDGGKLVWASEYGVPTDQYSEAHQAEYISDFLGGWSDQSYTGPSFIYTFRDNAPGAQGEEASMGVVRADGSWKPAARVIQQWTATHPQEAPDSVTLTASTATAPTTTASTAETTSAVAPMEATTVPQSALTTTAPSTETATTPTATATAEPTVMATEPTATSTTTGTTSTTGTSSATNSTSTSGSTSNSGPTSKSGTTAKTTKKNSTGATG